MFEDIFLRKKAVPEKLESYGFHKTRSSYRCSTNILDNAFKLEITISKGIAPDTQLIELATGEEYVLYKTAAVGTFVGEVRTAVYSVLRKIAEQCYETAIFKTEQAAQIIRYVREKYGDELEYLWKKFPDNAIWRKKDNQKWYGALLTISSRKLGFNSDEIIEIIDLRGVPEALAEFVDGQRYFPGWHMNKKHWYTIVLDGSVPTDELCRRIDESYMLAK
mgnify:CR=1 FL=1